MGEELDKARSVLDQVSAEHSMKVLRKHAAEASNPLERRALEHLVSEYDEAEASVRALEQRERISADLEEFRAAGGTDTMWIPGRPGTEGDNEDLFTNSLAPRLIELGGGQEAIAQALTEVGFVPLKDHSQRTAQVMAGLGVNLPTEGDNAKAVRDLGRLIASGAVDLDELVAEVFPKLEAQLEGEHPEVADAVRAKIREQVATARDDALKRLSDEVALAAPLIVGAGPADGSPRDHDLQRQMLDELLNEGGDEDAARRVLERHGYVTADQLALPSRKGDTCDLCGIDSEAAAVWHTEPFTTTNSAGHRYHWTNPWLTCATCDRLVAARDRQGLAEHCQERIDWKRLPTGAHQPVKADMAALHGQFLDHITSREDAQSIGKSTALDDRTHTETHPEADAGPLGAPEAPQGPSEQTPAVEFAADAWNGVWPREVSANGRVIADMHDLAEDEFIFITDDDPGLPAAITRAVTSGKQIGARLMDPVREEDVHIEILDTDDGRALVYVRGHFAPMFRRQVSAVSYRVFEARRAA